MKHKRKSGNQHVIEGDVTNQQDERRVSQNEELTRTLQSIYRWICIYIYTCTYGMFFIIEKQHHHKPFRIFPPTISQKNRGPRQLPCKELVQWLTPRVDGLMVSFSFLFFSQLDVPFLHSFGVVLHSHRGILYNWLIFQMGMVQSTRRKNINQCRFGSTQLKF